MYDSSYYTTTTTTPEVNPVVLVVYLAIVVLLIASLWKVFTKAGKPGWAAIIPIYNTIVMIQVAKRPIWWVVLLFIPLVNLVFAIILVFDIAKAFGKGTGFGFLLLFLPFIGYPILGFGDAQYVGDGQASDQPVYPPTPPSNPPAQPVV